MKEKKSSSFSREHALAQRARIVADKKRSGNKVMLIALGISAGLVGLGVFTANWSVFTPIVFVMAIGLMFSLNKKLFKKDDYYSIWGARYEDGAHRCIFCGHKGLSNNSVDAAKLVHINCPNCGERLYSE